MPGPNGTIKHGRARTKQAPKPDVTYVTYDPNDDSDVGQLQPIAARVLMKILYAARMCRFDLLRAVNGLATKVTRWDSMCDRRLHRLVSYINSSLDLRLTAWVGDNPSCIRAHLYCDADLGGCPDTQRSTSGVFQCTRA